MNNLASLYSDFSYSSSQVFSTHAQSSIPRLNTWLGGGLEFGKLSEWGIPTDSEGRELLFSFLKNQSSFLWIYSRAQKNISHPQDWISAHYPFKSSYLLKSDAPVSELLPVFTQSKFPITVIDSPQRLSLEDKALLSTLARRNCQHYILIRPFKLRSQISNPYSYLRLNIDKTEDRKALQIQNLQGETLSKSVQIRNYEIFNDSFS